MRRYLSLRPPPKISLKHDHNWTKGNDQSGFTVVKGIYPAPHIHEHLRYTNMATALRTSLRTT